jgi:hypothetical protein
MSFCFISKMNEIICFAQNSQILNKIQKLNVYEIETWSPGHLLPGLAPCSGQPSPGCPDFEGRNAEKKN